MPPQRKPIRCTKKRKGLPFEGKKPFYRRVTKTEEKKKREIRVFKEGGSVHGVVGAGQFNKRHP